MSIIKKNTIKMCTIKMNKIKMVHSGLFFLPDAPSTAGMSPAAGMQMICNASR